MVGSVWSDMAICRGEPFRQALARSRSSSLAFETAAATVRRSAFRRRSCHATRSAARLLRLPSRTLEAHPHRQPDRKHLCHGPPSHRAQQRLPQLRDRQDHGVQDDPGRTEIMAQARWPKPVSQGDRRRQILRRHRNRPRSRRRLIGGRPEFPHSSSTGYYRHSLRPCYAYPALQVDGTCLDRDDRDLRQCGRRRGAEHCREDVGVIRPEKSDPAKPLDILTGSRRACPQSTGYFALKGPENRHTDRRATPSRDRWVRVRDLAQLPRHRETSTPTFKRGPSGELAPTQRDKLKTAEQRPSSPRHRRSVSSCYALYTRSSPHRRGCPNMPRSSASDRMADTETDWPAIVPTSLCLP